MSDSIRMPVRPFAFGQDGMTEWRMRQLGFSGLRAADAKAIRSIHNRKPLFDVSKSEYQSAAAQRIKNERFFETEAARKLLGAKPSVGGAERMYLENPNDPWLVGYSHPNNAPHQTVGRSTEHMRDAMDSWKTNTPVTMEMEVYGRGQRQQQSVPVFGGK